MEFESTEAKMAAILEKEEIEFENVLDARKWYREEIHQLSKQLRDFKEKCKDEGIRYLKMTVAAKKGSQKGEGLMEDFDNALKSLLTQKSEAEKEISVQLMDLNLKLSELSERRKAADEMDERISSHEEDNAKRLKDLEIADDYLQNIEKGLQIRKTRINKETIDIQTMEDDLKMLRGDIENDLREQRASGSEYIPTSSKYSEYLSQSNSAELENGDEKDGASVFDEDEAKDPNEDVTNELLSLRHIQSELLEQINELKRDLRQRDNRIKELEKEMLHDIEDEAQADSDSKYIDNMKVSSSHVSDRAKKINISELSDSTPMTKPRPILTSSKTIDENGSDRRASAAPLKRRSSAYFDSGTANRRSTFAAAAKPRDLSKSFNHHDNRESLRRRTPSSETPKSSACSVM